MKSPYPGDRRLSRPEINPNVNDLQIKNSSIDLNNKKIPLVANMANQTQRGDIFNLKK